MFKSAGIQRKKHIFGVNVIMGLAKTSFVFLSADYLDCAGMVISLAGLGLGSMFLEQTSTKPTWGIALCIVVVCHNVLFFSIGLGPIIWVYLSQIFLIKLWAQELGHIGEPVGEWGGVDVNGVSNHF